MLRLTLWNYAEDAQHNIELYENAPVNLNYQFSDITEINKTKGSYTQTFRIPATKNNTDFFGALSDPASQTTGGLIIGNYNIKRKIRAELNFNSVPLMRGYVQIKAIYKQKKDFADIELVFFGETIDMASKVGDKMLSDLTTTSIDHGLNNANVTSSWAGTSAAPFDGTVRYGVMDKGRNWKNTEGSDSVAGSPEWTIADGLWHGDLTPYVRTKWILAQILTDAGYTYTSAFIDSVAFANHYMPAFNGSIAPVSSSADPEGEVAGVGLAADVTTTSIAVLPLVDTVTGAYDFGGNWDNTLHAYEAPFICEPTFTFNTSATAHISGLEYVIFKIWKLPAGSGVGVQQDIGPFYGTGQHTFTLPLTTSDRIYVTAQLSPSAPAGTFQVIASDVNGDGTWLRVDDVTFPLTGGTLSMAQNMPVIKQIDWVKGLQTMFNLVIAPDKNKPNHLLIEPFNDFIATGTNKDWSNKVDYKKDVAILPTTDLQKKQYSWSNDDGQDFISVLVQEQLARVYGRHQVTDPDNDFAVGELALKTPFAPYIMSHIPSTNFVINRCITNNGEGVIDPKPRFAFWCGQTGDMGQFYLRDDNGVVTTNSAYYSLFPVFSNYSAITPGISDEDLNFGTERAFFFTNGHALNTLYYKYWADYVNQLYYKDSRILNLHIQLNNNDIQDFEFSDRIYIEDSYYRINKIVNYDATQGGSTKVQLIKIVQDVPDCAHIPLSITGGGVVRFVGTGINYGNQECCEQYGYVWRKKLGRCYTVPSQIQPTVT